MEYHLGRDFDSGILIDDTCEIAIPENIINEWQNIVDLVARISGARAGLIMRVRDEDIEVFVASNTPNNPYCAGESERLKSSGLYCEKVIENQDKLMVCNALKSDEWKNNPDVRKQMISYLGFPIIQPGGKPFGTICLIDDKENVYSSDLINLMEKMRNLIDSHLKLLYLSYHDQLTGLYNRTFFTGRVITEMKMSECNQYPISILVLDLDNFKKTNDNFGHLIGDEVLKQVSKTALDNIRKTDLLARMGGEEFIVLMPKTSLVCAISAAEQIRSAIENLDHPIAGKLTVSIGVAERIKSESFDVWCKRADEALYRAKNTGRNKVVSSDALGSMPLASVRIDWKKEWESGNYDIDTQHKQLIDIANCLINMSFSGVGYQEIMLQLDALLKHISNHFASEEKVLEEIGYPDYEKHAELHKSLIAQSLKLRESYIKGEIKTTAFFSFVLDEVVLGHLIDADTKFFPYIINNHNK